MRLLAHLIAADVRHHRVILLVWVAVIVACAAVSAASPLLAGDPGHAWTIALAGALLWWAWLLLFVTIVPTIVQSHPVVGSTAFWMTRPVPAMTLLGSKALLLVTALVVLPALADVPQMAAYGIPFTRMLAVVAQSMRDSS